jgi:hypothetical protein
LILLKQIILQDGAFLYIILELATTKVIIQLTDYTMEIG